MIRRLRLAALAPLVLTAACATMEPYDYTAYREHMPRSILVLLTPVILLPISYFVFHERVDWQAIIGTLLAIAGVAILFLA